MHAAAVRSSSNTGARQGTPAVRTRSATHTPQSEASKALAWATPWSGARIQRKCAACEEEDSHVMRMADDGARPAISSLIDRATRHGRPLESGTRNLMESRFAHDFSGVRVHTGDRASASARAIHAHAYTIGNDIVFGAGQYAPHAPAGQRLIAHELTHVVQGASASGAPVQRFKDKPSPRPTTDVEPILPPSWYGPMPTPMPVFIPLKDPQADYGPEPTPQVEVKKADDEAGRDKRCGTKELPYTVVHPPETGAAGQGKKVSAYPLTKCPGNTRGQRPSEKTFKHQWECLATWDATKYWVRAHLLHGKTDRHPEFNLHGPGKMWNLILADQSLNQKMAKRAEGPAIDLVYDHNAVLWYESEVVDYAPGADYFAEHIRVRFWEYDTSSDSKGAQLFDETFPRKRPVPAQCGSTTIGPPAPMAAPSKAPPANPTPDTDEVFHGDLKMCTRRHKGEHLFRVTTGGVKLLIGTAWMNRSGTRSRGRDLCPFGTFRVSLMRKGLFGDSEIRTATVPVGKSRLVVWTNLDDGEYYFVFGSDNADPKCCLTGEVVVSTFEGGPSPRDFRGRPYT